MRKYGCSSNLFIGSLVLFSALVAHAEAPKANDPFRISLSVSPFTESLLAGGMVFTDGKKTAKSAEELQRLFVDHGANEVYVRINTRAKNASGYADHSLEYGIECARLAKKLGLPLNPELGLFRSYGDVRCQPQPDFSDYPEISLPGPWETLTLEQMIPVLEQYGELVAHRILDTGVEVRIWDLGNEVEFGSVGVAPQPAPGGCDGDEGGPGWYRAPDGIDPEIGKQSLESLLKMPPEERLAWQRERLWPHLARLFAAVASGIKKVDPDARFSTHVSAGYPTKPVEAVAFFQTLKENGYSPDELGFSFYPSSSGDSEELTRFKETMQTVMKELGRPAFIAEYGYAAEPMTEGGFAGWDKPKGDYPISDEGQAKLLRDIASWGVAAGLSGVRPWAPDLAAPGWEPIALFDAKDNVATARPALGALKEGAEHPDINAL